MNIQIILILFFCVQNLDAQFLKYQVIDDDEVIGFLTVQRTIEADTLKYVLHAEMKFSYLFMSHNYMQDAEWVSGADSFNYVMKSSLNGRESTVKIFKSDSLYNFNRTSFFSSDEFDLTDTPRYPFVTIYYQKPMTDSLFSSNYGKYFTVKKISELQYSYQTDKNKWLLKYDESGYLIRAKFEGFIDYELVYDPKSNQETH